MLTINAASPAIIGNEEQFDRLAPALLVPYAGMLLLILTNAWSIVSGKTILPRWMLLFTQRFWQIVFVLVPDIFQWLGAPVQTRQFVMSQCSGNAALLIMMAANAVWAAKKEEIGYE